MVSSTRRPLLEQHIPNVSQSARSRYLMSTYRGGEHGNDIHTEARGKTYIVQLRVDRWVPVAPGIWLRANEDLRATLRVISEDSHM